MQQYFVIYFGEDGISITPKDRAGVEKLVKETAIDYPQGNHFVDQYPDNNRGKSWEMEGDYPIYKVLIIKGEMIVPEAVQTVTEYKF